MRSSFWVLTLMSAAVFMAGCESKEDVAVAKAQTCLNTATSTTAMSCVDGLSNYTSEKAYLVRCSALYIKNGFTGTRLIQAFQSIKNGGGAASNAMTTGMALLTFTSTAEADTAVSLCSASGSISMSRLANLTKISTLIPITMGLSPGAGGITEAQMLTAVQNMRDQLQAGTLSGAQLAQIPGLASVITQSASDFCYDGSSFESSVVCTNLNTAITGTTSEAIVQNLLNLLGQ